MRSILKIAVKGLFKRKSYTISIFLLSLIAAVSMATALGTVFRIQDIYDSAVKKSAMPDMYYEFTSYNYSDSFLSYFKGRDEVKNAVAHPYLFMTNSNASINGQDISYCCIWKYRPDQNNFNIEGGSGELSNGEIYAPVIYRSQYNANVGDKITFKTTAGNKTYRIAGFADDPLLGSTFTNTQRVLFCEQDFNELEATATDHNIFKSTALSVYIKDSYQGTSFSKTTDSINKGFGKDMLASSSNNKNDTKFSSLAIVNIAAAIFLFFSALLIAIVIVVVRHAILSAFEADYVSFGILKAVGFTGRNLMAATVLQYFITGFLGAVLGTAASNFTIPTVGNMLVTTAGLFWSGSSNVLTALIVILILTLFICIGAFIVSHKITRISPVTAISAGKAPVYFSARLNIPLKSMYFIPLHLRMSLKQLFSRLRQYVSLIIITAILTLMMIIISTVTVFFTNTDKVMATMGFGSADITIVSTNPDKCSESRLDSIISEVNSKYGVKLSYSHDPFSQSVRVEDKAVNANIQSDFENFKDCIVKGRMPQYDNEVNITAVMSRHLDKSIGDYVEIESSSLIKKRYLIVGINQYVQSSGLNVSMTSNGYKRIKPDYKLLERAIVLNDSSKKEQVISVLKAEYQSAGSGISITESNKVFEKMIKSISVVFSSLTMLLYALTMLLIVCIVLLLCVISFYRESIDTGIFKAVGFTSGQLRKQFTIRFILVSFTGGLLGLLAGFCIDKPLLVSLLLNVGMGKYNPEWSFLTLGVPVLFIIIITGITAYLTSARIKRISPSNLISE